MAITPINNAMIPRSADLNVVKQQEDSKPLIDQQNIQLQMNERADELSHQVINPENSRKAKNDDDARDEGKNKYQGKRQPNRNAKAAKRSGEDRVIEKKSIPNFDIRI